MVRAKHYDGVIRWVWQLTLVVFVVALAGPPPLAALMFIVNSTADSADANLSDTICAAVVAPDTFRCTLRAAVQEANTTDEPDDIRFASGLETVMVTGSIVITGKLTISGQSNRKQRVNGIRSTGGIFDVQSGIVHFQHLILEEGREITYNGGCINITSDVDEVVVTQVNFVRCESVARNGGAIANAADSLLIIGGAFIGNVAEKDGGAIITRARGKTIVRQGTLFRQNVANLDGGAMANVSGGTQDVEDAQFVGNSAGNRGGAVAHQGMSNPHTKISDSRFADNLAAFGGAMCDVTRDGLFESKNNTDAGGNFGFADPPFQNFFCFPR